MPTPTPNLNMTKPDIGEVGWGSLMNGNLDILDALFPSGRLADANGPQNFNGNTVNASNFTVLGAALAFIHLSGTVSTSQLPATVVRTDQANSYASGKKQTFSASSTTPGMGFTGVASDPSTLTAGDVWQNTTDKRLKFYDGSTAQKLAHLSDVANLKTSGQGYVFLPCDIGVGAGALSPFTSNKVMFIQVILDRGLMVRQCRINVTTGVASTHASIGIYSADGQTKLVDSGTFDTSTAGTKNNTLATPVYVPPGVYLYAYTSDGTPSVTGSNDAGSSGSAASLMANGVNDPTRRGISVNASVGGVLPSSLGTLASATVYGGNSPVGFFGV